MDSTDVVILDKEEAWFSRPKPELPCQVRIKREEDLTGRIVEVTRRDDRKSRVRLTKQRFAAGNGKPALYQFEDVDPQPRYSKAPNPHVEEIKAMSGAELCAVVDEAPAGWQDMTARQRAAVQEVVRRGQLIQAAA